MTIGVYGIVAGIVKIDNLGFWLQKKTSALAKGLGNVLVAAAPWLMKILTLVGTIAMFLVGGGIMVHGVPQLAHLVTEYQQRDEPDEQRCQQSGEPGGRVHRGVDCAVGGQWGLPKCVEAVIQAPEV